MSVGLIARSHQTVTYTHSAITVGATTTKVLDANPDRKYALFVNNTDETIYLVFGESAQLNYGILLTTKGSAYSINAQESNLDLRQVNVIGTSGTAKLLVVEGV